MNDKRESSSQDFRFTVGCETTGTSLVAPVDVLNAFQEIENQEATLLLICKRNQNSNFSIRNHIEKNGLSDRVTCLQYYERNNYSDLKRECKIWIRKNTPLSQVTGAVLKERISASGAGRVEVSDGKKHALFFTGFHPYKEEGQGVYMRLWLDALRKTGHEVHLVHYQHDWRDTPVAARSMAVRDYQHYHEIPVSSQLVGINETGLNVDLDDWCGIEALAGVEALADRFDYELALVVYPFYTAVFNVIPSETRKILVTPDSFTDRNRKMLAQGFSEAQWISITREGEKEACLRADAIAAIKDEEADYFRDLVGNQREVYTVSSLSPHVDLKRSSYNGTLRIGYYASDTQVNCECVLEFLELRAASEYLSSNSEVILAGGFCKRIAECLEEGELKDMRVEIRGRMEDLADLYQETDLLINPDKGGTGLKIKTLEPMYFGMPVVCTLAGGGGLESGNRFHKASCIAELVKLLEEVVRYPELLEELSEASRKITENLNRITLQGISELLQCDAGKLDPGFISLDEARSPALAKKEGEEGVDGGSGPLISVVLPFFNAEKNLGKAVASVSENDYRNMEIILVNDASTDSSRQIAEAMAHKDDRIRILDHHVNMGAGPARNTGALDARGEYLFFLDSDDILRRHSLELLVRTAVAEGVELVIGSCNQVDERGNYGDYDRVRDGGRKECFGVIEGTEALRRSLNVEEGSFLPVRPWGMLINLEMFRASDLTFPPGEYEDLSVLPFLYRYAGKVVYLEDIVVTYRIRKGSVTNSPLTPAKVTRYSTLWDLISERIESFGLEQYRRDFKIFHIGHLLWLLTQGIPDEEVLNAVADLIKDRMKLDDSLLPQSDGLQYMLEYISGILNSAGKEQDFILWEKFVSHLGDEALTGYFRHRIFEIIR